MPLRSKAQTRWAYANKDENSKTGAAAREFIAATPKGRISKLPERLAMPKPKIKRFGSLSP